MSTNNDNQIRVANPSQILINNKVFIRVTSHLVLSAHLNAASNLFGGLLVQWADECAGIYVMEILKTHHVVTKKISEVLFNEPAKLGDVLEFLCCIKAVGKTSITIECITRAKQIDMEDRLRTILNCDLVFVKIDKFGRPAQHNFVLEGN
jgi:acyl-CoA hydrolase